MSIKSPFHNGQQSVKRIPGGFHGTEHRSGRLTVCIRSTALCCFAAALAGGVQAADSDAIIGKNDWLFVRHELVLESLSREAQVSLEAIGRIHRMMERNNITLAVTMIPSKMEMYAEQLPDDFKISPYMTGFNDASQTRLRSSGVHVVDLKKSMREAAQRDLENPLFFRLDTHWTHTGALVAARTLRAGILDDPSLKKAFEATPEEDYQLVWSTKKYRQNKIRDITHFLPTGTPPYPPEETRHFTVTQKNRTGTALLDATKSAGLALVGSSFSGDWTGFPDALRFALQRNVFNFSINADAGPWAVMRAYLQNDAFQIDKPKLILWEIPERSVLGPNYAFRLPRYRVESSDWLLQVAALIETGCTPMSVRSKLDAAGVHSQATGRAEPSTLETDYVEINFDQAVDASGYLSAQLRTDGSRRVTIEAWDHSALNRKFTVETAGDDRHHALKTPLSLGQKGITRLKIYPGTTNAFSIQDIRICRFQENWLKSLTL